MPKYIDTNSFKSWKIWGKHKQHAPIIQLEEIKTGLDFTDCIIDSYYCLIQWHLSAQSWLTAAAAKSLQLCPTLCDPIDSSPPGSPVPGILQARTLEWVAISFSKAWKWKVKGKSLSHVWLFATPWTAAHQAPPSMRFSRQEYWSGVPSPSPLTNYQSNLLDSLSLCFFIVSSWERLILIMGQSSAKRVQLKATMEEWQDIIFPPASELQAA